MPDDAQVAETVTAEHSTTAATTTTATEERSAVTTPSAPPAGEKPRDMTTVTWLMSQGKNEADALLEAVGMRDAPEGEATDLAQLIRRRLANVAASQDDHQHPHAPTVDDLEIQKSFLAHRFVGPLKTYERTFRAYSVLDNFLNLTSILAGVGASLAAALNAPKVYAIVLGLVVGALQSLSQWLKPSRRSTRRGLAAADMRTEAWAFLQGRDRYKGKDAATAWALFCDQIERVEDREQAEQDREAAEAGATKTAKSR